MSRAPEGRASEYGTVELSVPDTDCPSCAGKVERSVRRLDGVGSVDPEVTTGRLSVDYDVARVSGVDVVGGSRPRGTPSMTTVRRARNAG